MKLHQSLLFCLAPGSSTVTIKALLQNAQKLANCLKCSLQVAVSDQDLKAIQLLGQATIMKVHGNYLSGVLELIPRLSIDAALIPLSAESIQSFLEQCVVPVLLVPEYVSLTGNPVEWILVPMSIERPENEAMSLGIQIGCALTLPVDILHVVQKQSKIIRPERFDDAFYHEYPHRIEQMITQASPYATIRERRCVRNYLQHHGQVAEEITKVMENTPNGLLILEWNGVMVQGHAERLKWILQRARFPVLIIRSITKAQ